MDFSVDAFKLWYRDHQEEVIEGYRTFLKFKSIGTDRAYDNETRGCAEWLKEQLMSLGLSAQLWETEGQPVLFAQTEEIQTDRPTLLLYHHYDVQPADPLDLWNSDPFAPEVRDGKMYARGAQDNKGQCFYTITALKALVDLGEQLPINIKLFIEGEEESGSFGSGKLIQEEKYREALQADYLLVVDGGLPSENTAAITLGMRGIACVNFTCKNSRHDLHSGMHGGIALNPAKALMRAISSCWNSDGEIQIPHFFDGIKPISEAEKQYLDFPFDEAAYKDESGVSAFDLQPGISPPVACTMRPTLEINGFHSGYGGEGTKTIIPSEAHAKLSARLVPGQDPNVVGQLIGDYVRKALPKDLKVDVELHHGGTPFMTSAKSSFASVVAKSYEDVFNAPCQRILSGGSIPIVTSLEAASGAETVVMGYGVDSDAIHAPNEHFGLDRFEKGVLTIARIVYHLSKD